MRSLDDPNLIASIDREGMLAVLERTPEMYRDALRIGQSFDTPRARQIYRVLFLGMGHSAIGGSLIRDWALDRCAIPIEVSKDYLIPKYVDEGTLVLALSYSGNTEETLTALLRALDLGCLAIGFSSGGLLERLCLKHKVPHVKIPGGFQPRAALPYLFLTPALILERWGILESVSREAKETIGVLEETRRRIDASIPSQNNNAKRLASQLLGTIPIIYGAREYASVAFRLKIQFNENSKILSAASVIPEMNHNEVVGWKGINQPTERLSVILIRGPGEPTEIKARIEVTKEVIAQTTNRIYEVWAEGDARMARMLSAVYQGDYASLYLAVLNGVDPTPVKIIDWLKRELDVRLGLLNRLSRELE